MKKFAFLLLPFLAFACSGGGGSDTDTSDTTSSSQSVRLDQAAEKTVNLLPKLSSDMAYKFAVENPKNLFNLN